MTSPAGPSPSTVDSATTRCLIAVAHQIPAFARRVIDVHRTAEHNALPPAQGIAVRALLGHALIARRQRGLRTVALTVVFVVFAALLFYYAPIPSAVWALIGLCWLLLRGLARLLRGGPAPREHRGSPAFLLLTAGFFCYALLPASTDLIVGKQTVSYSQYDDSYYDSTYGYGERRLAPESDVDDAVTSPSAIFLAGVGLVYLVLVLDVLTRRYWLTVQDPTTPAVDAAAARLARPALRRHWDLLDAAAELPEHSRVLVHDGWDAFVGDGVRVAAWTMPIALRRRDESAAELTPRDLYDAVATAIEGLRESDRLAPGQRLRNLRIDSVLVASAQKREENTSTPLVQVLHPQDAARPATTVPSETVEQLMDQDEERVRHFQRCSVTSWDSTFQVATLFNVGCDRDLLYLEWNAYCLFPVADHLRSAAARMRAPAPVAALRELAQLVASRPNFRPPRWFTPPEESGVQSVREIAAGMRCSHEFQDLDGQRYLKLLETRTLTAVRQHLSERGFATENFETFSEHIVNNNTTIIHGGEFVGAQSFGPSSSAVVERIERQSTPPRRSQETT